MTTEQGTAIARDNHFVSIGLLRQWAQDERRNVFAYRLLVPHENVPEWQPRAIKGLAYRRDLYTGSAGGREHDDFEKGLTKKYEHPGLEAIDGLVGGRWPTAAGWRSISRLVAAQDVRTPLAYVEFMQRWERDVPGMIGQSIQRSIAVLEKARDRGVPVVANSDANDPSEFSSLFEVAIEPPAEADSDHATIRGSFLAGRRAWIATMRHVLTGVAERFCERPWSVVEPAGDAEWPLTDHPVLRLNYNGPESYDFGGGWGNPGSEIMMPVSPRHLLYVKVGAQTPEKFAFSRHDTRLVQRLLVQRAYGWVFSTRATDWVPRVRPRRIDLKAFEEETAAWESWHQAQLCQGGDP